MLRIAIVLIALQTACAGCRKTEVAPCSAVEDAVTTCAPEGASDRPYDVYLGEGHDVTSPAPVLFLFHGGGGNREGATRVTCPGGDRSHPRCLHNLATARGWIVVAPSGTSARLVSRLRTWNGGGGSDGWQCVSGRACKENVDDMAYFDAIFESLERLVAIDHARIYASGLSNGGAISHRLACERAGVIAAIAPVGGANQFETTASCAPSRPVAVLQVHGTEDPCWALDGGPAACAQRDDQNKQDVDVTVRNWAARNGCSETPRIDRLPDVADDGMVTERWRYDGCAAPVEYLRIEGGGHTYPDGYSYLSSELVGGTTRDFGSEQIVEFLERQSR